MSTFEFSLPLTFSCRIFFTEVGIYVFFSWDTHEPENHEKAGVSKGEGFLFLCEMPFVQVTERFPENQRFRLLPSTYRSKISHRPYDFEVNASE